MSNFRRRSRSPAEDTDNARHSRDGESHSNDHADSGSLDSVHHDAGYVGRRGKVVRWNLGTTGWSDGKPTRFSRPARVGGAARGKFDVQGGFTEGKRVAQRTATRRMADASLGTTRWRDQRKNGLRLKPWPWPKMSRTVGSNRILEPPTRVLHLTRSKKPAARCSQLIRRTRHFRKLGLPSCG